MCTASAPQKASPTFEEAMMNLIQIAQQNAAIDSYKAQSAEQQRLMTQQLQQQIDAANAATAQQQQLLAQAQAQPKFEERQGAYAVETKRQAPSAAEAKTTELAKEKRNPRATLKIAPGSTAAAAGAGLNIGT